jgi:hypothetical protein
MKAHTLLRLTLVVWLIGLATLAVMVDRALAHQAPTGWVYPANCCSNQDCREVTHEAVVEVVRGYEIVSTGELIPMTDHRIRRSPDGEFHWCSVAGAAKSGTVCLFVPDRGF